MLTRDTIDWSCYFSLPLLLVVQTVVPSAISSGDTTEFQTFDVGVHANEIRILPKFKRLDQSIGIKEVLLQLYMRLP